MARVWIEDRSEHSEYVAAMEKWRTSGKKRRAPGRWRVRWYAPDGSPKSKTCPTKPDAERERGRIETQLNGGTYRDPSRSDTLFSVICEDWFSNLRRPGVRTKEDYREILDLYVLPYWGDWKASAIDWESVDEWITHLDKLPGRKAETTMSAARVIKIFRVGGMVAKRAIRQKMIAENPFKDHELPVTGDGGEHVYLTHEEVERLAAAAGAVRPEFGTLIRLKAYCGPRWGEISAIKTDRLTLQKREIRIVESWSKVKGGTRILKDTKNHERRTLPVPVFLCAELKAVAAGKKRGEFLFTGEGTEAITYGEWRGVWAKAVKAASLDGRGLTPHKLRHTAASLAIASGANVKDVQTMLGHKSAAMTLDVYGHLWPEGLHQVAGRLDAARAAALAASATGEEATPALAA